MSEKHTLHSVAVAALVRVGHTARDGHRGERIAVGASGRKPSVRVRRRHPGAVVRAVLQNVAVDRLHVQVALRQRALAHRVRVTIAVAQMATLVRQLVSTHAKAGVAERQVSNGLLVVVCATIARTIELLALKLVLNPLAVGRVADEREDGTNALDEKSTLCRLRVIQGGLERMMSRVRIGHAVFTHLHAIVAIGVPQKLLEARTIKQLANEYLPRAVLGDTDALRATSVECNVNGR